MMFKWTVPIFVRPMFAVRSDMSEMSMSNSGGKSINHWLGDEDSNLD